MKDINLLPTEISNEFQKNENEKKSKLTASNKTVVITVIVAVVLMIAIAMPFLISKVWIGSLEGRLSSLNEELQEQRYVEIQKVNSDLASISDVLFTKKDIIDSIENQSYPVNSLFNTLSHVIPEGTTIKALSYNAEKGELTIKVNSDDQLKIGELISNVALLDFISLPADAKIDNAQDGGVSIRFSVGRKGGK